MKSLLCSVGFLTSGRGVWCTFKHPKLGNFGVINVYASTGQEGRGIGLNFGWKFFMRLVHNDLAWVINVGNFNMVANLEDQAGGHPHVVAGRGKREWDHLKRKKMVD